MPRFFFNIHDGVDIPDREGTEFENWQAARLASVQFVGEVLVSEASHVASGDDWHLEVTDETGLILFRLTVTLNDFDVEKPVVPALHPL